MCESITVYTACQFVVAHGQRRPKRHAELTNDTERRVTHFIPERYVQGDGFLFWDRSKQIARCTERLTWQQRLNPSQSQIDLI